MKNIKEVIISSLILLLVLTGCSGENQSSGDNGEDSGDKTLSLVAHPAYSLQSSDPARVEYLNKEIEEFEENSDFTINSNALSSNIPEAMAKLMEQASQGRAPDIAQIDSYIFPRYYEYLQPLDKHLKEYGITADDFFPFAQNIMKGPDDKIYGFQFTTDTRVLYYRKDLIDTPPKTWEEVLEISDKLTQEGSDAFLYPAGRGEGAVVTTILPMFWGQGGKLVDDEGNPVFGEGKNREAMLNVFSFVQETIEKGYTPRRVANYGAEDDLNAELTSGNVAMFLGGNWQANQIKNILGEEEFKNWGVAPIPQKAGAKPTTTAGGWAWGVFAEEEEKQKAAVDFLVQTFVGEEGMANWTTVGGYLPTRKSVYDSEAYEGNEFTDQFRQYLEEQAQMRPSSEAYPDISSELQIAISSVASGEASPEEALNQAWEAMQ